ncbi:MAG: hypothetical protein ACLRSW_00800 [Christensenellaceae bacterium]
MEVLLYGTELAGKNYKEAAEILFDRCVKLGYFSASGRITRCWCRPLCPRAARTKK